MKHRLKHFFLLTTLMLLLAVLTACGASGGGEGELHCTVSISCATVLDNWEQCDESKRGLIPPDGVFLPETEVSFTEGESVFDVLERACKANKLHMEFSFTPAYDSAYVEGIGNLYEFDMGALSGWMYAVNGWCPNYGCSQYALQDGDTVEWHYTCDLGADIGQKMS